MLELSYENKVVFPVVENSTYVKIWKALLQEEHIINSYEDTRNTYKEDKYNGLL